MTDLTRSQSQPSCREAATSPTPYHLETSAEFDAYLAAVDAALAHEFGPDHQRLLGGMGTLLSEFVW